MKYVVKIELEDIQLIVDKLDRNKIWDALKNATISEIFSKDSFHVNDEEGNEL